MEVDLIDLFHKKKYWCLVPRIKMNIFKKWFMSWSFALRSITPSVISKTYKINFIRNNNSLCRNSHLLDHNIENIIYNQNCKANSIIFIVNRHAKTANLPSLLCTAIKNIVNDKRYSLKKKRNKSYWKSLFTFICNCCIWYAVASSRCLLCGAYQCVSIDLEASQMAIQCYSNTMLYQEKKE